jgi:hypothetical protein
MRESQHEPTVEVGEAQEATELYHSLRGWPVMNELDLGRVHMHPMFIHDVPQVLNLIHVNQAFL